MSNNLPQGWIECKLEDILIKLCNGTSRKQNKNKEGIPVTRIETISDGSINFNRVGYISDISKEDVELYRLTNGDILFSNINSDFHLGKTAIYSGNELLLHGMNLLLLRFELFIAMPNFINYYLTYCRFAGKFIKIAQHAVNQSSINQTKLKNFSVRLPSFNEQKRIVEKIEEEFSKIDEGVDKLKLIQEQIKQYHQSVLKSAFDGRLHKITGWKEEKLANLCYEIAKRKISNDANEKFLYIDISSIDNVKNILIGATAYNGKNAPSRARQIIKSGDILFSTVRTYLKNIAMVDKDYDGQIASTGFCIIRAKECVLYNKFIFYKCLSQDFLEPLNQLQRGSSYPAVRINDVLNQNIYLPSLAEQQKIVEEIERRFKIADEVEKVVNENLEKAEQLKQSILKKAFEGRLVPQDPNDEPASVLLEKIKSEREKNDRK